MATMLPEDIEKFKTDGEQQVYYFLRNFAKPDSKFISIYQPDVNGKDPDFLLINLELGIIVLEVKDWNVGQIISIDQDRCTLLKGSDKSVVKNPLRQSKDYVYNLMDKIRKDKRLVQNDPRFKGKIKVPISYGVIFPNINKFKFMEKGFHRVIDVEKVFFGDDLHPQSDLCRDNSGEILRNTLLHKFRPTFESKLTDQDLIHLRGLLFSQVIIELPERSAGYTRHQDRVLQLDYRQEFLARKFDGGHRIIKGPSGSGKTIVLVHKAAFLKRYNPKINNILFVCYNITLVNYIKTLLANKRVPLGSGGVDVCHFYQLCAKILNRKVSYSESNPDYYSQIVSDALAQIKSCGLQYDAILMDEGQDFSDDMYKIVVGLLNPETDNLTICGDEKQNIYQRVQTWKDLGIKAQGRVLSLTDIYRNTSEILNLANNYIGKKRKKESKQQQLLLFPNINSIHGPQPEIIQFVSYQEAINFIREKISQLTEKEECPLSEIAIGYTRKSVPDDSTINFPSMCQEQLETSGILSNWIAEDTRAKESYDISSNRVIISTIHSIKGLDYDCMFLLGLDLIDAGGWTEKQIDNLVYVALTRAKYWLFIPYVKKNYVIERLLASQ